MRIGNVVVDAANYGAIKAVLPEVDGALAQQSGRKRHKIIHELATRLERKLGAPVDENDVLLLASAKARLESAFAATEVRRKNVDARLGPTFAAAQERSAATRETNRVMDFRLQCGKRFVVDLPVVPSPTAMTPLLVPLPDLVTSAPAEEASPPAVVDAPVVVDGPPRGGRVRRLRDRALERVFANKVAQKGVAVALGGLALASATFGMKCSPSTTAVPENDDRPSATQEARGQAADEARARAAAAKAARAAEATRTVDAVAVELLGHPLDPADPVHAHAQALVADGRDAEVADAARAAVRDGVEFQTREAGKLVERLHAEMVGGAPDAEIVARVGELVAGGMRSAELEAAVVAEIAGSDAALAAVLRDVMPAASEDDVQKYAGALNDAMREFHIDNPARKAAFLAQIAHESGDLNYDEEIASGRAYEGRGDLGNTQPGDGVRYKGRGLLQLTGRANYRHVGAALGVDLEGNPGLAKEPVISARIAGYFWESHGLNELADRGEFVRITRLINGGTNGLGDRLANYADAREALHV